LDASYQQWPFAPPLGAPADSLRERWWQECFVATPAIEAFAEAAGPAVLLGRPGSGKSVAVHAWLRRAAGRTLLVPYPPHNWPRAANAWLPGQGHFAQMLAAAAGELVRLLTAQPELFRRLSPLSQEFLAWLVERHLSRRQLHRLGHHLQSRLPAAPPLAQPAEELYGGSVTEMEVWSQAGELVELAQALGFDQVGLYADLDQWQAAAHRDDLLELLNWLSLLEYPGLALRLAAPLDALPAVPATSRLAFVRLESDEAEVMALVERCLAVATVGRRQALASLATPAVLDQARAVVAELYEAPSPRGWLDWAETLLYLTGQKDGRPVADADEAVFTYFRRHVPLRLEEAMPAVWRGPQRVALEQQSYELLQILFASRRSGLARDALLAVVATEDNLHGAIGRLRGRIEPVRFKNDYVYIQTVKNYGYYLEQESAAGG
jgi:hypothetical protein